MSDVTTPESTEIPESKVFLSYSWTTPEHEQWVHDLAERLHGNGIDVVFDKWDLLVGHDKYAYMERIVNDPLITKVLLICDKGYAEKANRRSGGVGDETQIVTPEIYRGVNQDKFIPVIAERDENGKEYLPSYLKPRIYVDLSNPATYEQEYVRLGRIILGLPEYPRPPRGKIPSYFTETAEPPHTTTPKLRAVKAAVQSNKPYAAGAAQDFLDEIVVKLKEGEVFLKDGEQTNVKDIRERIGTSVDSFLYYRDEFVSFIDLICRYGGSNISLFQATRKFFFNVSPLMYIDYKPGGQAFRDTYQFLIPELFLYAVATMMKQDRYNEVSSFLGASYPDSGESRGASMDGYTIFSQHMTNIYEWARSERLSYSGYGVARIEGAWLKERAKNEITNFNDLSDADFVLFLRDVLQPSRGSFEHQWFPYLASLEQQLNTYYRTGFPFFARAASRDEFKNLCLLLNVRDKAAIKEALDRRFAPKDGKIPSIFGMTREILETLMSWHSLDTR